MSTPRRKERNLIMKYDYHEAVTADIRNYITENGIAAEAGETFDDFYNRLNDELWIADSVTGNASGSYTFNAWQAEEYLCHNGDLLKEAIWELGWSTVNIADKGAEWCDVAIRCYLLGGCLYEVLDEMFPDIDR